MSEPSCPIPCVCTPMQCSLCTTRHAFVGGKRGGKGVRKTCSYCKTVGHRKNFCPKLKGTGDGTEGANEDEVGEELGSEEKEEDVKEAEDAVKKQKETKIGRRGAMAKAVEKKSDTEEVVSKKVVKPAGTATPSTRMKASHNKAVKETEAEVVIEESRKPATRPSPTRTQPLRGQKIGENTMAEEVRGIY